MDISLLQLLGTKNNWTRFRPFVKEHTLSKEGKQVFGAMDVYYKAKGCETIDWVEFEPWFYMFRSGSIRKENAELFKAFFVSMREYKSTETEKDIIEHYVKMAAASAIGEKAHSIIVKGDGEIEDINDLCAAYEKEVGRAVNTHDLFTDGDSSAILDRALKPGLNWRLPELNRSCGPVRGGDFILVSAYVGVGKTTFTADQVSYMAGQLPPEKKVVWINNEERSDVVSLRIRQAATGLSIEAFNKDRPAAEAAYVAAVGSKDKVYVLKNDQELCNTGSLNKVFADMKPGLIVFDVLDKVEGMREKDEKEDRRLGRIYKWARRLAHEYDCPVIAVTQTDATGNVSEYIGMDQLRGSKVDKPAEADLIITIGKNRDVTKDQNTRYIHIPKNKLTGGGMFDETMRLGHHEVKINGPICRYESC